MARRIVPFRERLRQKRRVLLFICTGNTCRSPMAAAYLRKLLKERDIQDVDIRSAGVMTITGLLASPEAVQVMAAEDVDLSRHRSSQLTPELIRKADLILAMTPFHRQTALRLSEDAKDKTFLLKEYAGSDLKNVQIADPMGCTLEVFKKCFKEIKAACNKLIDHRFIAGDRQPEPTEPAPRRKAAAKAPARKKAAAAKKKTTRKAAAKKAAKAPAKKEAAKKAAPRKATAKKATKAAKKSRSKK